MDARKVINTLAALEERSEEVTDKAALLAAIRVLKYLRSRDVLNSPHARKTLAHLELQP
jgi:hypothetical protein